jgi:hypothetical protein
MDDLLRFMDDYAPHSSYPYFRINYVAWAQDVYRELQNLKENPVDVDFKLREILVNILFQGTSEAVDGTGVYQDLQDAGIAATMKQFREIYESVEIGEETR